MDEHRKANQRLWDEWTEIHQVDYYGLEVRPVELAKQGWNSLWPLEREEVGNVAGKSLLHLQCHFGMDTMSWARLGAKVTGIDFSERAVARARELVTECGVEGTFVQSDLYELPEKLDEQFDVVYTSYGAITWLPDINGWAKVATGYVKPGGFFYIAEFHPIMTPLDENDTSHGLVPKYPYFETPEPTPFPVEGSYADPTAEVKQDTEYSWSHGLGEIVTALIDAGLRIEYVHEHPFTVFPQIPDLMERSEDRYYRWKDPDNDVPLMFSIKAWKD